MRGSEELIENLCAFVALCEKHEAEVGCRREAVRGRRVGVMIG